MGILLSDGQIDKAMEYAINWAQDYTIRNGRADSIPERQVAKAQLKQVIDLFRQQEGETINNDTIYRVSERTLQEWEKEIE